MKASEAIKKLLPFPGVDGKPIMIRGSQYVKTVYDSKGGVKACVSETVYHIEIQSFYDYRNLESWVKISTGFKKTPEAVMNEWNRLVNRIRKEVSDQLGKKLCEWSIHDEDYGIWAGSCGAFWNFEEGGPKENEMAYCPECGGVVVFQKAHAGEDVSDGD